MENTVRWSVIVSSDTDIALRTFLAQHGLRKGELSKFIEEAVRAHLFERTINTTKERNRVHSSNEIQALIDEAIAAQ